MLSIKNGVYYDSFELWGLRSEGVVEFGAKHPKNIVFEKNCLPPCSVGETLTTFDPDIGKYFAAMLSKIMTLRKHGKKKERTSTVPFMSTELGKKPAFNNCCPL